MTRLSVKLESSARSRKRSRRWRLRSYLQLPCLPRTVQYLRALVSVAENKFTLSMQVPWRWPSATLDISHEFYKATLVHLTAHYSLCVDQRRYCQLQFCSLRNGRKSRRFLIARCRCLSSVAAYLRRLNQQLASFATLRCPRRGE